MYPFEYANPTTVKDAVALLGASWSDANILAGGTDQMNLMKDDLHQPKRLVNIKSIKALGGISKSGAGIRIGATVTSDELMENALVRAELPALVAAARGIGSQQIRNMGTVAGDLCQRPRCWYFRNGFGLLGNAGGTDLVTALHDAGVPLAIASGSPRDEIEIQLRSSGLAPFFLGIVTADDVHDFKPLPEPYLKALALVSRADSAVPEGVIAIEDSMTGMKSARAAGLRVIGVANSHPREKLVLAHHVVDSLTELTVADIRAVAVGVP